MYSLSQLQRGLSNPNLLLRECNRLYHRRFYTRQYNIDGVDIFAEDWDNLIILDACRYDMFAEYNPLPGKLESRQSRGSATVEFLRGNVDGTDLRDTVYVTANPKLTEHEETINASFHNVVDVWVDGWDDERRTVLPETTTEYAIEAAEQYPNKRLLVHYVQPHYPFLVDQGPFDDSQAFERPDEPGSWHQMMTGAISPARDAVWDAYLETLQATFPAVRELLDTIEGRSVITADHGNMVGDRARPIPIREWGHPDGIYTPELVTVPWLIQDGERRKIVREASEESEDIDPEIVKDRLTNLGYKS